jgi:hypothetical protein
VTMEAIDVEGNRLLWRGNVSAASNDMIGLRQKIGATLRQGLMPRLGASPEGARETTRPSNPEAYDLFLRASATSHDPDPNRQAIAMLEKSIALDGTFAPAWKVLGLRSYYESIYGNGGTVPYERARVAYQRAIALDPGMVEAAAQLVIMRTEAGDLEGAYDDAIQLVRRRPDNPEAHHTLGYVLRYAGLLEEAARECETAISIDPKSYEWRSCALNFILLGRFERARHFVALDAGSVWALYLTGEILLREGKTDDVARLISGANDAEARMVTLFLRRAPEREIDAAAEADEAEVSRSRDSEPKYWVGSMLSYCGRREAALRLLRRSVEEGSVNYPAMDLDPQWANVRSDPRFAAIRSLAIERQKKFLAHRAGSR